MKPVHENLRLELKIANISTAKMSNRLGFKMYRIMGCILNEINPARGIRMSGRVPDISRGGK